MIIMHHHICPTSFIPNEETEFKKNGWKFNITPEQFEFQITHLLKTGYRFVSIKQYDQTLHIKGKENWKDVVMTFDDGWIDNFEYALPLLKKHKIPALFFLTTHQFEDGELNKMNLAQIVEMKKAGMDFGSHTCNHHDLTKLPIPEASFEITESKNKLEKLLSTPIDYFAYPGGAFNAKIVELVQKAGYKGAVSVLSPAVNTTQDLFWLFRNIFSNEMTSLADKYRLNRLLVKIMDFRVREKLVEKLK